MGFNSAFKGLIRLYDSPKHVPVDDSLHHRSVWHFPLHLSSSIFHTIICLLTDLLSSMLAVTVGIQSRTFWHLRPPCKLKTINRRNRKVYFQQQHSLLLGYAVAQLVEALRYKAVGRGFKTRWCHNPSSRTMALGLTQPLTEMSTRNISWGVKTALPSHLHIPKVLKSGSLKLLDPSGSVQACNGIALPLQSSVM